MMLEKTRKRWDGVWAFYAEFLMWVFGCKNVLIAKSTQELVDPKSGKHH